MVDGAALLMAMTYGFVAESRWSATERGVNLFDTFTCADGGFIAVGAIEPQFFRALVAVLRGRNPAPVDHGDARHRHRHHPERARPESKEIHHLHEKGVVR